MAFSRVFFLLYYASPPPAILFQSAFFTYLFKVTCDNSDTLSGIFSFFFCKCVGKKIRFSSILNILPIKKLRINNYFVFISNIFFS